MTDSARHTPLFEEHARLGAKLVPFAGWQMPIQYAGISAEHRAVRERAGLFDVSHMGELLLTGPGALGAVNRLVTNDAGRLADGQAMYTCCCREDGGILDDLIVYRSTAERLLVVCNASNHAKISAHFAEQTRARCTFEDRSDATALLAVQGPRALEVLEAAGSGLPDLAHAVPPFRFRETSVAGLPCTLARTGYTGEDGVELFVASSDAVALWRALLRAGTAFGLEPAGLGARDTLRLEARLALYGNELGEDTNPWEAGLGWTVKLDKAEFIGKAALRALEASGLARKLVGFEMLGRGVARHGYPLCSASGEVVGVCTSGAPSPTLGKAIGLGYVPVALAGLGTELLVDCRGRLIPARVVPTPFYKRPRSS